MSPKKGSKFLGHSHVVDSNAFKFALRSLGPSTFISTLLVEQVNYLPAGALKLFPRRHDLTKGSIFGRNGINRIHRVD